MKFNQFASLNSIDLNDLTLIKKFKMFLKSTLKTLGKSTLKVSNVTCLKALPSRTFNNARNSSPSVELFRSVSQTEQKRTFFLVSGYNGSNENLLKLPPPTDPSKKTLVLDLDEVLITSLEDEQLKLKDVVQTHESCGYTLTKRPGVDEFLLEMSKHFEVVLLTSSVQKYADINLEHLPDVFVHRRYRHHIPSSDCAKRLSSMGRDMDKIILIDDNRNYLEFNPENQILMPLFAVQKPDDNLKKLTDVLLRIAKDEISIKDACKEWNPPSVK